MYCVANFIGVDRLKRNNEIDFSDVFYVTNMYPQHYPFNVEYMLSFHAKSLKAGRHFLYSQCILACRAVATLESATWLSNCFIGQFGSRVHIKASGVAREMRLGMFFLLGVAVCWGATQVGVREEKDHIQGGVAQHTLGAVAVPHFGSLKWDHLGCQSLLLSSCKPYARHRGSMLCQREKRKPQLMQLQLSFEKHLRG